MSWIQIKFDALASQVDELESLLLTSGASSVTLESGKDTPVLASELEQQPLWEKTRIIGLFEASIQIEDILNRIQFGFSGDVLPECRVESLEERDWSREWMRHFEPVRFGSRLWVCPGWQETPDKDGIRLELDPGMAFGTGTHPTTALCLEWIAERELSGTTVIDYGCGSGILAIASLLLGAKSAVAVDIDPEAVRATAENAARNGLTGDQLRTILPDRLVGGERAELVFANILAGPLVELAPKLSGFLESGGRLILSGILADQCERVVQAYLDKFDVEQVRQQDEWALISAVRR